MYEFRASGLGSLLRFPSFDPRRRGARRAGGFLNGPPDSELPSPEAVLGCVQDCRSRRTLRARFALRRSLFIPLARPSQREGSISR